MSELMEKLAVLRDRDKISEISLQFCYFLERIEPNCSDELLQAGCLTAQRKQEGDVCVKLADVAGSALFDDKMLEPAPMLDEWLSKLNKSDCVGKPGENRPLILDETGRLYLQRYWNYEAVLAEELCKRARKETDCEDRKNFKKRLDNLFGSDSNETDWQKVAAWSAARQKLTVISGGPGTGKTTTVVKILLLEAQMYPNRHIALAAPTGKAASRLMESVDSALEVYKPEKEVLDQLPDKSFTIHKLLGARRFGAEFRYNKDNPLPYDLIVIDEASMIDLALMVKLLEALPEHAKLILLGDKDQLASVEAGAVLGSICSNTKNLFSDSFIDSAEKAGFSINNTRLQSAKKPLTDHIVLLEKSYRFGEDSGIGLLANSILEGDTSRAGEICNTKDFKDVQFMEFSRAPEFKQILSDTILEHVHRLIQTKDVDEALAAISELGILCVHRKGPLGANQVNNLAEELLRENQLIPATSQWYKGKPVMVTRNDYSLGLRNGELGITLTDKKGELKVYFQQSDGVTRSFYPSRLSNVETAFAITVHKSQGSEFENVAVILPPKVSPVSSREMLYTAVTRARNNCTLVGSKQVFNDSINKRIDRSSGLKDRLWG